MNLSPSTQKILLDLGLLNKDKSFTSRLSVAEVYGFLSGQKLSATSGRSRLELWLDPKEKTLKLKQYTLDKDFSLLKEGAQKGTLQTLRVEELSSSYPKQAKEERENSPLVYPRKFFVKDPSSGNLLEVDPLKNRGLVKEILQRNSDPGLERKYRAELFKIRKFLLESLKKNPTKAKEIGLYLTSVGKEIQKNERKSPVYSNGAEKNLRPSRKASISALSQKTQKELFSVEGHQKETLSLEKEKSAEVLLEKQKEKILASKLIIESILLEGKSAKRSLRR